MNFAESIIHQTKKSILFEHVSVSVDLKLSRGLDPLWRNIDVRVADRIWPRIVERVRE